MKTLQSLGLHRKHSAPQDDSLAKYQHAVEALRRSPYMNYPAHVHMETYAKCNAACTFCPYPVLDRKGEKMSDQLIEKIIGDLVEIPASLSFNLSPFKVNEPFLDVRLFDILALINERLPNANITLTSNASPITELNLGALGKVKNLEYLWISFNYHRPFEYERTMALSYARTIERLNMIHLWKAEGRLQTRIVLSRVGDGTAIDNKFCNWVRSRFPLFEFSVFRRGNWLGQVQTKTLDIPDVGCTRWFDISITATGVVAHCCMDGEAKFPIGNVCLQSVLEIYNSPCYRSLRESTVSRLAVAPCNSCSFL